MVAIMPAENKRLGDARTLHELEQFTTVIVGQTKLFCLLEGSVTTGKHSH